MKDEQRIKVLEDELKVLKNEIKAVLLDLREQCLNVQNPFNFSMVPGDGSGIVGDNPDPKWKRSTVEENKGDSSAAIIPYENRGTSEQMPSSELFKPHNKKDRQFDEKQLPKAIAPHKNDTGDRGQRFSAGDNKTDLVVIAGLTQWIDQATAKLGKERTEVLIEMSFATGRLSDNLKDALIRMARLSHHESNMKSITASDYLAILAQLENLLSGSKQQDNALLSIISMMKDYHDG